MTGARRLGVSLALFLLAGCGQEAPSGETPTETPSSQAPAGQTDAVPVAPSDAAPATAVAIDGFRLPAYDETTLAGGTRLVLMPKRDVPLVAFHATLAGGVAAEPAAGNGVAALTAALLRQGAGQRDAREFADTVAAVGGEFRIAAKLEAVVLTGEFMSRDSALMVELLADVLRRPVFAIEEFDKMKTRSIRALAAARDADLRSLIKPYAHAHVHGSHPYGRALTGSEASLERLRYEDVRAFHADHFGGDRLTLTVVGDFDPDLMTATLTTAFADWRPAGSELPVLPPPAPAGGGRVLLVDKPGSTQTYFWIGNLGAARGDAETPAINLVNTLFGGRFTSMLNNALRVESGLTYGARSLLDRHTLPGTLGMFSFCATENTVEAIDLALTQLDRLHAGPFDEATMASGRNYILGTYTLGLETGPQLAAALGELKFYGLPDAALDDYAGRIAGLSAADAAAVVERIYPELDGLVYVLIGDGDAIRDDLAAYGEVTELAVSAPGFAP